MSEGRYASKWEDENRTKLREARVGGGLYLFPNEVSKGGPPEKVEGGFKTSTLDSQLRNINNGRLKDIDQVQGDLFAKTRDIVLKKDNQDTSIKGILENNPLNDNFFSDMNTDVIQSTIRYNVYKSSGKVIDSPSSNSIYIIMRSILLQYGNFKALNVVEEIKQLNSRVIHYCTQNIESNLKQHLGYITELGKLPVPLDKPYYGNKQNFTYDISNLL